MQKKIVRITEKDSGGWEDRENEHYRRLVSGRNAKIRRRWVRPCHDRHGHDPNHLPWKYDRETISF
jgi:hypothetical protein